MNKQQIKERNERRKIYDRRYYEKYRSKLLGQYKDTDTKTLCKCPKCEKNHYLNIYWVGNGKPRKYCHRCKYKVQQIMARVIDSSYAPDYFGGST